ncbi:MAG: hypothetical protein JRF33_25480 [Deltaproteobacteria bacterium]|nr:hypothetical protein [Deltaproteobacteria bacterium]
MKTLAAFFVIVFLVSSLAQAGPLQDRIIAEAERHLGKEYVFGGRDGRPGCLKQGRRVTCAQGIDCQSLIFFALEKVLDKPWRSFSVMPSKTVKRCEWGKPVSGLMGVLRAELKENKLHKADALFFLLEDYNLEADKALWKKKGKRYGVWHTGLVHRVKGDKAYVIHAKPGHKVVIEPLQEIEFEALYVVRIPPKEK